MYFFVAIFFITNSAFHLVHEDRAVIAPGSTDANNKLVDLVGFKKPLSTPNIYLLIYDAYVSNETMLGHGIDNSAQEEYLETLGFELYPHIYSNYALSTPSMSGVLYASANYSTSGGSGKGEVQNLLRSFGYETYGIFQSDYFFRDYSSSYDFTFPKAKASNTLLVKAIFMGEFRFDVAFDAPPREQFVKYKVNAFRHVPKKPRFVYMHDFLPGHSQNSGACLPNETELFRERLIKANYQMKQDVETIIREDHGAIIIVAGDHGPCLTKNCTSTGHNYDISEISRLDIQDRFGAFLAIKWPTEDFSEYDDITVLQDIFPAIFAYIFEDNQFLEAKVEAETVELSPIGKGDRALGGGDISGASVKNGIIHGGINDGEPLFIGWK